MSVRNYYSALSHGDHHLWRIMEALKASKHAENTIVILLSDHGFHLGNRDHFKKTTLWEQVSGVPFVTMRSRFARATFGWSDMRMAPPSFSI
ncbi:MAG: sulfatase-like hydrolase/transferase [Rhodobacteraceae bacterium]|nr:sulfatase-like hydrolase/transferase [Paracoccaceae bacterium]